MIKRFLRIVPWKKAAILFLLFILVEAGLTYVASTTIEKLGASFTAADAGLLLLVIAILASLSAKSVMQNLRNFVIIRIKANWRTKLHKRLAEKICRMDYTEYCSASSGEILSRFNDELPNILSFWIDGLFDTLANCVISLTAIVLSFFISWKLALASYAVVPLIGWLLGKLSHKLQEKMAKELKSGADLRSTWLSLLKSHETIKAYHAEEESADTFAGLARKNQKDQWTRQKYWETMLFLSMLSFSVGFIVNFGLGGLFISVGAISYAEWAAFYYLSNYAQSFLNLLPGLLSSWKSMKVSLKRLFEYFDLENEQSGSLDASLPEKGSPAVETRNLRFSYKGSGKPLLDGLDLAIYPGEKVVVCGKNGSGKSTLASLFTGLFRPEGGKVYLNGKDLAECDLASVRKAISFVEQDAYLFGGGIQENVALGKGGNASREEITAALSRASFASADPDKEVGDGGSALSGGQRQRVALARAFVHSSPVLILDEGTRALDKETAKSVIKGLLSDKDLTVIAIAHDLDPFREFDRFILIDSGKAASFESFQELIDRHPDFARIPNASEV